MEWTPPPGRHLQVHRGARRQDQHQAAREQEESEEVMPKPRVNPTKAVLKSVRVCREILSDLTDLSESLIEAKIRAGTFPKPRQAWRVAWLLREIEE